MASDRSSSGINVELTNYDPIIKGASQVLDINNREKLDAFGSCVTGKCKQEGTS